MLAADGVVVVAHALPEHLHELRGLLGTIAVAPDKTRRIDDAFAGLDRVATQTVTWRLALDRDDVHALALMGPSAHHLDPTALHSTVEGLPDLTTVTAAAQVTVLRARAR